MKKPKKNSSDVSINPVLKKNALGIMKNTYSPYSECAVGASLKLSNGKLFSGCNVENSSFGCSVCAERVAIWNAISSEGPKIKIVEIVVATDASPPWTPCGLCRQVLNEFAEKNCVIYTVNKAGESVRFLHSELLPHSHDPSDLK